MGDSLAIGNDGGLAGAQGAAGLRKAAEQLEGQFVRLLFAQMGKVDLAGEDAPFGNSQAEQQFRDLLHDALSERAAGGLGIADAIVRQLSARAGFERSQGKP